MMFGVPSINYLSLGIIKVNLLLQNTEEFLVFRVRDLEHQNG